MEPRAMAGRRNDVAEPQRRHSSAIGPDGAIADVRRFLHETLPPDWPSCGPGDWVTDWRRTFAASGWAVPAWPVALGGLGLDAAAEAAVGRELIAAEAPVPY